MRCSTTSRPSAISTWSEAYIRKLVINGERNQDQLTVKALLYLKKREG